MKNEIQKYPAYKDSGVEWLGEIPSHWTTKRIKHLFSEINERSFDGSEDLLSVSQYTGVTNKTEKLEDGGMLTNAATLEGYKKVWEGDLVSNIMLAWNGSLGFSPFNGITSPAYSIYRLKTNDVNRYFHYLLRTELYKSEFKRNSSGVIESRLRLYTDDFFGIESILPPLPEQTAIAAFLDRKTALIDQAIDIKQKQIELLKERRQILIHKAVTRGLNPNVKMKDSGVEWIGEIPEGWEVLTLRRITVEHKQGYYSEKGYDDNGYSLVRITDLDSEGNISTLMSPFVNPNKKDIQIFKIDKGDFLFPRTGTIGLLGVAKMDLHAVFASYLIRFRFSKTMHTEFLQNYFISNVFLNGLKYDLHGGVVQNLHAENIKNQFIPKPPIHEQILISENIKNESLKFDTAISLKEQEIEKLKEYKATLINSAVTGKIKVYNDAKQN